MQYRSRRHLLAAAGASVVALLAGCATDEDGTSTDEGGTTAASTASPTAATTRTTTGGETTATAEPPTQTESRTTTESTTRTDTETATATESTTEAGPAATVTVGPGGSLVFDPGEVTVAVGETVEWRWDSGGHNVVVESQPDGASWAGTDGSATTTYGEGHTHSFSFEVAGTYEYYCAPHQSFDMRGTVVVE